MKIEYKIIIGILIVLGLISIFVTPAFKEEPKWKTNGTIYNITYYDTGERSVIWDYTYDDKEWKYFKILNANCKEVICPCAKDGCLAYCMECEELLEERK